MGGEKQNLKTMGYFKQCCIADALYLLQRVWEPSKATLGCRGCRQEGKHRKLLVSFPLTEEGRQHHQLCDTTGENPTQSRPIEINDANLDMSINLGGSTV